MVGPLEPTLGSDVLEETRRGWLRTAGWTLAAIEVVAVLLTFPFGVLDVRVLVGTSPVALVAGVCLVLGYRQRAMAVG